MQDLLVVLVVLLLLAAAAALTGHMVARSTLPIRNRLWRSRIETIKREAEELRRREEAAYGDVPPPPPGGGRRPAQVDPDGDTLPELPGLPIRDPRHPPWERDY